MVPKHTPIRTCIICSQKMPKRDLVRIVRLPQGTVEIDPMGKKPGRGSYLCHEERCWEQALKKNKLDYTLRGSIQSADKDALLKYSKSFAVRSTV